jgi:hypothetical protein
VGEREPVRVHRRGARSGTTLLQRMVDAHPEIAVIHESHWVPRFYVKRIGLALTARSRWSSLRGCSTTAGSSSWASKGETWKVSSLGCAISYADYVTRIFNLYGQVRGKRLVGEKTPGYVRNIPTLHYLSPEAR